MTQELVLGYQYTDRYAKATGSLMEVWAYVSGCFLVVLQPATVDENGAAAKTVISYDQYLDDANGQPVTRPEWMATRAAGLLGKRFRDQASGFEGTATGVRFMLNGTQQASLQPKATKKSILPKSYAFDLVKLEEITKKGKRQPVLDAPRTGGPDARDPRSAS